MSVESLAFAFAGGDRDGWILVVCTWDGAVGGNDLDQAVDAATGKGFLTRQRFSLGYVADVDSGEVAMQRLAPASPQPQGWGIPWTGSSSAPTLGVRKVIFLICSVAGAHAASQAIPSDPRLRHSQPKGRAGPCICGHLLRNPRPGGESDSAMQNM